jgi:transcriptional regulator with XRE-family HTH domain
MPSPPAVFHVLLRGAMSSRGINARKLADMIGRDESTVGRWISLDDAKRTEPSVRDIAAICDALDVSADHLLGRRTAFCGLTPGMVIVNGELLDEARKHPRERIDWAIEVPPKVDVVSSARAREIEAEIGKGKKKRGEEDA